MGQALALILDPSVLILIALAAAYGVFIGAVPGLTATMGVALAVPFTFFLDPLPALAVIVTLEATAIFAGDIPGALVRIPGTPASAAYSDDLYALTMRGESGRGLGVSLVFSVFGGLIGCAALVLAAPALAQVAFQFTTYEYTWLAVLGLSAAAIASRGTTAKGLFSMLLGVLISTVGLDEIHGSARLTFGVTELAGGIGFIPAMIGLFGVSEVLRNVLAPGSIAARAPAGSGLFLGGAVRLLRRRIGHALRSSGIGAITGALPGAGADIGAWLSYGASKRLARDPEAYGRGSVEGVSDATAANNAALAGAWVPALVFGVPGDSVTAIVIGVLVMKGLQPGPAIFTKQPHLLHAVYLSFLLANLLLLPIGALAIRAGRLIVTVPRRILLPAILLFAIVGSYAINNSAFDIGVCAAMGLVGFLLERHGFPVGPVVLGLVLGPMVEKNFMASMAKSGGSLAAFFSRPVAGLLGAAVIALWAIAACRAWRARKARGADPDASGSP
ncbi:MAG: tripartite tricarboxylate transporter permease [Planctomycetes bacterium]|nr:tripartite tricarboxylate transporter permease [Planctomycetota bacterium]